MRAPAVRAHVLLQKGCPSYGGLLHPMLAHVVETGLVSDSGAACLEVLVDLSFRYSVTSVVTKSPSGFDGALDDGLRMEGLIVESATV